MNFRALASAPLRGLGIDPMRFWLLTGLFAQLAARREILTQLGRDGVTLKAAAWMYFVLIGFFGLVFAAARPPVATYLPAFLLVTAFVLLGILLSETGNSLVNATEGLVLAHQPINGATYTAAKLTHLFRILLYFVPGLNAGPAVAGLLLPDSGWLYPLLHLAAAFAAGFVVALLCCSVYGWLIRFVPAARLKAAGQLAEVTPLLIMVLLPRLQDVPRGWGWSAWLAADPAAVRVVGAGLGIAALAAVVFGLRSLSADFLLRVSTIVQGGGPVRFKPRRSRLSNLVARLRGGPACRAGFEYLGRMMRRDYQFRRQLLPLLPAMAVFLGGMFARGWGLNPFAGRFSSAHLIPHAIGFLLLWICMLIPFGSHYQGAWIFLTAPGRALGGFARGIHAMLWVRLIAIPHVVLLALLIWRWGPLDGGLFTAFSLSAASLYLGLELRLIGGVPFGRQPQATKAALMFPLLLMGGAAIAAAVALQHFLLFQSRAAVGIAAVLIGGVAVLITRGAVQWLETSIRFHLGMLEQPSAPFFTEIEA